MVLKRNQNILIDAIEKFLEHDKLYLLDGHFCLIGEKAEEILFNNDVYNFSFGCDYYKLSTNINKSC